jgi:dTDP-4-dehydrorhamnose reductase
MGWFLRQTGEVSGFSNHVWSGITSLDWARACTALLRGEWDPTRALFQPAISPPVTKWELLRLLGKVFDHDIAIKPTKTPEPIDRSLVPDPLRDSLEKQLWDLKKWYGRPVK